MPDVTASLDLDTLLDDIRTFMNAEVYPLEPDLMTDGFTALRPALSTRARP